MTVKTNLSEIRAALATMSAIHAQGHLTRDDVNAVVRFVEERCAEIEATTATSGLAFGVTTLPVLTLSQIAAEARAEGKRAAGRRHLRVVPSEGDAA